MHGLSETESETQTVSKIETYTGTESFGGIGHCVVKIDD